MEIITKINRERGFDYRVDREGNVIKSRYNYFKDWKTYMTFLIVLLGYLYYTQMKSCATGVTNLDKICSIYDDQKETYYIAFPEKLGTKPDVREILSFNPHPGQTSNLNISGISNG